MPVARALDRSDLLLHLDGEGLQTRKSAAVAGDRNHGRCAQAGRHDDQDAGQFLQRSGGASARNRSGSQLLRAGQSLSRLFPAGAEPRLRGADRRSAFRRLAAGAGDSRRGDAAYQRTQRLRFDPARICRSETSRCSPERGRAARALGPARCFLAGNRRPRAAKRRMAPAHPANAPAGARLAGSSRS